VRRLDRTTAPHPLPDGEIRIVHLGLGAFHRAHQAVLTQQAGDGWAICAVAQRSTAVRDALREQDNVFTVAEGDRLTVVGSIREVLHAGEQPDLVTARLSEVDAVTVTVTEAGYRPDGPVVAQLVRGLRARDRDLTVISCDNLPDNGRVLERLVHDACDPELREWVAGHVTFPSSVVDQIVPAVTEADLRAVSARLGLVDRAAVVAEPYRHWVIEDRFAGPHPKWDAVFTDDIAPHQKAKLRLVNGTHSALAYLGLPAGYDTTAQVAAVPEFAEYVRRLVTETGRGLDPDPDALLARFANPAISHRLAQIAADGDHKLPQRLVAPAMELLEAGAEPRMICLALAAYEGDVVPDELRPLVADAARQLARHGVTETLRRL
jgi:fructuronate reductase